MANFDSFFNSKGTGKSTSGDFSRNGVRIISDPFGINQPQPVRALTAEQKELMELPEKELIERIHTDFFTAGEKLLKEAKDIISKTSTELDGKIHKLDLMQKHGLTGTEEYKQFSTQKSTLEARKKQEELIMYYGQKYPFYKFINDIHVSELCLKYGLVFGPIHLFHGFVPLEKLEQMESFKVDTVDCIMQERILINSFNNSTSGSMQQSFEQGTEKKGFMICAPKKDMDMRMMQVSADGYTLEREFKDPVVLQPVKGGYLIVCAWGAEASDPIVVNNINN